LALIVLERVLNIEQFDFNMKLSVKLKLIRKHLGYTQDQIAEKLGLTSIARRGRVSEWESGKSEPKRQHLIKYSEIGNVEIQKLIDDKEDIVLK
jgi:transcriptional regulator with XRE-family HTH domain